jgi:hypothetical protein
VVLLESQRQAVTRQSTEKSEIKLKLEARRLEDYCYILKLYRARITFVLVAVV